MTCAGRRKPPDLRGARPPENKQGFGKARNPRNHPWSPAHQPCPLPLRGRNWHPAHCSSAPAAHKWSDAQRRAVPPTPRAPAGIFYPRPSNKPLAAGARASPRPELARTAPAPSPFKSPLPPPPPLPPPRYAVQTGDAPPPSGDGGKSRLWEGRGAGSAVGGGVSGSVWWGWGGAVDAR